MMVSSVSQNDRHWFCRTCKYARFFFKRVIKNLMSSGVRPRLNSASYTNLLCDPGQLALQLRTSVTI